MTNKRLKGAGREKEGGRGVVEAAGNRLERKMAEREGGKRIGRGEWEGGQDSGASGAALYHYLRRRAAAALPSH